MSREKYEPGHCLHCDLGILLQAWVDKGITPPELVETLETVIAQVLVKSAKPGQIKAVVELFAQSLAEQTAKLVAVDSEDRMGTPYAPGHA